MIETGNELYGVSITMMYTGRKPRRRRKMNFNFRPLNAAICIRSDTDKSFALNSPYDRAINDSMQPQPIVYRVYIYMGLQDIIMYFSCQYICSSQ
jgi:hypothetical protein